MIDEAGTPISTPFESVGPAPESIMSYPTMLTRVAERLGAPPGVVATLGLLLAALIAGSFVRLLAVAAHDKQRGARLASLATWWTLSLLFGGALLAGPLATAAFFALAAFLGTREYLALTIETRRDRVGDVLALIFVPAQFLVVLSADSLWPWLLLPLVFFLILPVRMMLTGTTYNYVHDVGTVFWGVMLLGFAMSHVMLFAALPAEVHPEGHWAGWVLFLVLLTETNDIAQALWGRQLGRHKVTPTISPNKTWEGLLFGMVTTIGVALAVHRLLVPLSWLPAAVGGWLIAVGGFLGDINMSAVKRDLGVKDSSSWLPGQGGVLDRLDSLSFSAPLFYHYVRWLAAA